MLLNLKEKQCVKSVMEEIELFASTTTIDGVEFVARSTTWIQRSFWIVCIIGGIYMTARDCANAVNAYLNETTSTIITVRNNPPLEFKDTIICINYNPLAFGYVDANELRLNLSLFNRTSSTLADLRREDVDLLYTSIKLVTAYGSMENSIDPALDLSALGGTVGPNVLDRLREFYIGNNVTLSRLWQTIGTLLCQLWHIRIFKIRSHYKLPSMNPCAIGNVTWLGVVPYVALGTEATSCVKIGHHVIFDAMTENIVISYRPKGIYRELAEVNATASVSDLFALTAYVDVTGDVVSSDLTADFITFDTTDCTQLVVGIDGEYTLLSKMRQACDQNAKSLLNCYGQCKVEATISRCGCFPDSWNHVRSVTQSSTMSCFEKLNIDDYFNCSSNTQNAAASKKCRQECLSRCTFKNFDLGVYQSKCFYSPKRGEVAIELLPKRFVVAVFEEQLLADLSSVVSNVGGIVGLWLGAGLMGIIHALIQPMRILLNVACKKNV